jgi:hypothetical protein
VSLPPRHLRLIGDPRQAGSLQVVRRGSLVFTALLVMLLVETIDAYYRRRPGRRRRIELLRPDLLDKYRNASECVDCILKGEKPADSPVQAPTGYELAIKLETARYWSLKSRPLRRGRGDP